MPRIAVVLAAGRSERLQTVTGGGSKALVKLGGLSLVERAVRRLQETGVESVFVVLGYHAGPVGAVVSRFARGRVRTVLAEGWEAGNGASLAATEDHLRAEALFLLVTADHVFGEGALDHLARASEPAVLLDPAPSRAAWDEGCRVRIRDGVAEEFSKELDAPAIDCGAFLLPPEVFDCQRAASARGDDSLAGAVSELAARRGLRPIAIPQRTWWHDVDTPEDLHQARSQLRRALARDGDGPVSRYVNRPISTRFSMAIASVRLSPDLLSFIALLVGLFGAWLLGIGGGVAGGIAVQVSSILDGVDGEMARLLVRAGPRGALLDGVMDRVGDTAIVAGLGVWALSGGSSLSAGAVLVLAVAATAGSLMSMASKDRAAALGLAPAPERLLGYLLGGRDGRLLLIAVGAIAGRPALALAAVAATSAVTLIIRVYVIRRSTPAAR